MTTLSPVDESLRRALEIEANTDITIGAWRTLEPPARESYRTAPLTALAKLLELKRRAMSMSVLDLAHKANIMLHMVVSLESGQPTRSALSKLAEVARALDLPEQRLKELAGLAPSKPEINSQAMHFVSRAMPVESLTPAESQALDQFVDALESE